MKNMLTIDLDAIAKTFLEWSEGTTERDTSTLMDALDEHGIEEKIYERIRAIAKKGGK